MTADALLLAAERMFAEHGADVPLRDIAKAAGQRNNSAVQYYFGDRQGLVQAIVVRRLASVESSSARLLAQIDARDTHALVDALVTSLLDASTEQGGTHYFRFLEVMRNHVKSWPADEGGSAWSTITETLGELLPDGTQHERSSRISSMATTLFALLADHERASEAADALGPTRRQIVEMLVGLLGAPLHPQ
ncbi:TetR/AcrR family transcriptional regulator [Rhodococcus sp. NPDC127528]|uniref:TetR/AcrR family transcriptional regulator n=1 Tax=unclassified Rhodococcus (in: high G+C Gram-positive bacteria) TaxID=192944 RepID=UPI00362E575D